MQFSSTFWLSMLLVSLFWQALEKAIGDDMPNSAHTKIEPILKQVRNGHSCRKC